MHWLNDNELPGKARNQSGLVCTCSFDLSALSVHIIHQSGNNLHMHAWVASGISIITFLYDYYMARPLENFQTNDFNAFMTPIHISRYILKTAEC